jgi:hypothetical protein
MKIVFYCLLLIVSCLFIIPPVRAEYVLPYPSTMPGNKLYKVTRIIDSLKKYWYFGNIAQVKYHLGLSDKYLVEAKTLFEYKQYLLATDSLKRSNDQFSQIHQYVVKAEAEGENMQNFKKIISDASIVHQQVLEQLLDNTPEDFEWRPEKAKTEMLYIHDDLHNAISIITGIQQ